MRAQAAIPVSKASVRLGLSEFRTRELIRMGLIPAFRPGGRKYLIREEDLEAFIKSRRVIGNNRGATAGETGGEA